MAERRLEIIISARDEASKVLGGLGSTAKSVGSTIGSAAKIGVAGTATLIGGLTAAGAGLLALGSDAEEMQAKFDTVFGGAAPAAQARLDELAGAVGRNKFELREYASVLQDTFVPLGFAREQAAQMSTDIVALAEDVASFNNLPTKQVIADIQSALVGNTETLRKYGVVATQAAIEQEALNSGLLGAGEELDAQTKAQAIYNLILQGTTDAQGDAARTAGSFANQMRGLRSSLTEAATAAGTELLPVVTPLLQGLTQMATDILPQLVTRFTEFAGELGNTTGPALLLINDALTRIGAVFGSTDEQITATDALLAGFGATLDAIVIGVQAFAITMQGVALAVEKVNEALEIAVGLFDQAQQIASLLGGDDEGGGAPVAGGQFATTGGGLIGAAQAGTARGAFGQAPTAGPTESNEGFLARVADLFSRQPPPQVNVTLDGQQIASNIEVRTGQSAAGLAAVGGPNDF